MNKMKGMQPDAAASLSNAFKEIEAAGIPVHLNSGYRDPAQQKALYAKFLAGKNPYPVAPPGQSAHQMGTAADLGIAPEHREAANAILAKHGWTWNGPSDEVHYDFSGALSAGRRVPTEGVSSKPSDIGGKGDPSRLSRPSAAWVRGAGQGGFKSSDPAADQFLGPVPGSGSGSPVSQGPAPGSQFTSSDPAANQFLGPVPGSQQPQPQATGGQPSTIQLMLQGQSTPPPPIASPSAINGDQGILGNAAQYWSDWANNSLNPFNGQSIGAHINSFIKPAADAMDVLSNGILPSLLQHTWGPVSAGMRQALNQDNIGNNGFVSPQGRSAIGNSIAKAWSGRPDPTLPAGGLISAFVGPTADASNTPGLSPFEAGLATFASGALKDLESIGDIGADWEVGGKFAHTFFTPILRGSAVVAPAIRAAAEGSGPFAGAASRIAPIFDNTLLNKGVSGVAGAGLEATNTWAWKQFGATKLGQAVLPTLQAFAKTGADYRAGLNAWVDSKRYMNTADNLIGRTVQMANDYAAKLNAAGVNVTGNALDGTGFGKEDFPELQGRMDGNMVGQLVTLYSEAGSQGSFLTEPEVLHQASVLGMDPAVIANIGDEYRKLDMMAGRGQVAAGMMTPETFTEQAGTHIVRSYKINRLTKTEASSMAQDLADNGHQNTNLFARVQNVAVNGGAEEGGSYAGSPGLRDIVKQRELLTPEQRLATIPDLDFTKSTQALRGQFQEIAKANLYKAIADPALKVSLGNQLASETWNRGPVNTQARFQGELARGQKAEEIIKNDFEKQGGVADTQNLLAGKLNKTIETARGAYADLAAHQANEPVEPQMPAGRRYTPTDTAGPLETAEQRVARKYAERPTSINVEAAKDRLDQNDVNQYIKDLNTWQRQKSVWQNKLADLTKRTETARAAVDEARQDHDAHFEASSARLQELDKQRSRNQLLSGARPANYGDATDALNKAVAKVPGAEKMPQALQDTWKQAWLKAWNERGDDIFHDIPPQGLPRTPAGLDPKVIEAMGGNNPLVAAALNPNISVPGGAIQAADAIKRGMVQWGSGNGNYGPMEGRWASVALKKFIDDALDPSRFTGEGAKGATGGIAKFFGEMMRSGKLYMNPISTMNVFVQSIADNMITAADAGKLYNPLSDSQGRAGWDAWSKGGPMMPHIQAMLDYGNEMQGSARHGIDPFLVGSKDPLGELGQKAAVKNFRAVKEWMKSEFVREQLLPKAGLVKVLMDQGMSPMKAAEWAERAHGGSGVDMGGIETPGLMHLAENLNRNGIAMFTSYPLHSISRIMELMVNRPDLVMRWPLLRNYMIQNSSPEMQAQAKEHNLEFGEAPIPTSTTLGRMLANPDGSEGVINLGNAIPYGGAFGGLGFPNIASPFTRAAEVGNRGEHSGLNPQDDQSQKMNAFLGGFYPGTIGAAEKELAAYQGRTPSEGATIAQTPLQGMAAFAGLPMSHPETAMSREFGPKGGEEIPSRLRFWQELDSRYGGGYDSGEDVQNLKQRRDLRNSDPEELEQRRKAAVREMDRLMKDRAMTEKQAQTSIRHQSSYIHALMELASEKGPRLYDYTNKAMGQPQP